MSTLTRANAKDLRKNRKATQADDFVALDDLPPSPKGAAATPSAVDGMANTTVGPARKGTAKSDGEIAAAFEAKPATAPKKLSTLASAYLMGALEKATQPPSPALKASSPDYFVELAGRAQLLSMAEAKVGLRTAFQMVVQATAIAGAVNVYRLLSDLQRQITWQATLDIQRDRKGTRKLRSDTLDNDVFERAHEALMRQMGMVEATPETGNQDGLHNDTREAPVGLDRERDPDYIAPPTEHEVLDALVEINAYLGVMLRVMLPDERDRAYVSADLGVPFTTRVEEIAGDRSYHPVHDAAEAIEVQIEANRLGIERRRRKQAEAAVKANAALFALLDGGRMPPSTDEPAF